MSDLKVFHIDGGSTSEIEGSSSVLERTLQRLIENNLYSLLSIHFLKSEHSTGHNHAGRIDTLGLDENICPVIIEYKRSVNQNVINQGLFYLDWLLDHKAEFKMLVIDAFGRDKAESVDWSSPRLICIAADFTRYDEHAVRQIHRNIELIRYRQFGEDLLLLDLVTSTSSTASPQGAQDTQAVSSTRPSAETKTISDTYSSLDGPIADLYAAFRDWLMSLGDDVQEKILKNYYAYRRLKNFACVEIHPVKGCLRVSVKLDPKEIELEEGFTRDVSDIGHYGTGDLEIILRNHDDLERAKPLIKSSYDKN